MNNQYSEKILIDIFLKVLTPIVSLEMDDSQLKNHMKFGNSNVESEVDDVDFFFNNYNNKPVKRSIQRQESLGKIEKTLKVAAS